MLHSDKIIASPIHRLPRDVLWYIFNMNANMFLESGALDTTRRTAQVCRDWRQFMLAMPSLWGKLIDIDRFRWAQAAWRTEVVRRTGSAMLWIKAWEDIENDSKNTPHFFLDLLGENWWRVQKLVARIDVSSVHPTWWTQLYLPAPHLQVFDFSSWETMDDETCESWPFGPLFLDTAPMLYEFRSKYCKINVRAPWLGQLRSLDLRTDMTVMEMLTILQHAPNLKLLRLDSGIMGEITTPLPLSVSLPKLDSITLFNEIEVSIILLDHIDIPHACSFKVHPYHIWSSETFSDAIFRPILRTLSAHARRYFRCHTPSKLSMEYTLDSNFCIEGKTTLDTSNFQVSLSSRQRVTFPENAISIILDEFSLPEFAEVPEVHLCLLPSRTELPIALFWSYLARLPSIKVFDTDEQSLAYFVRYRRDILAQSNYESTVNLTFPSITTLKLTDIASTYFLGTEGALRNFIMSRIEDGCPIDVLDLLQCNRDMFPNLDFLEKMAGLKVLWEEWGKENVFEYVCGSGQPERLRFSNSGPIHYLKCPT